MKNSPYAQDSKISIKTEVKVGKSYKSKGWSLKKEDFEILIPSKKYDGKCHIKINNIIAHAKIRFGLRLFYSDQNNLRNHLENLYEKDPNAKIPLELKLKSEYLYENFISKYSNAKPLKSIDIELFVGKSFKSKGWKMSKEFNSIFIPINEYPEKYDIIVDKIQTEGRLEIGTRVFYKSEELSSYLKKLYEEDENSRINAKLIFDDELIVYDLKNNYKNDQLIKNSFKKKEIKSTKKYDLNKEKNYYNITSIPSSHNYEKESKINLIILGEEEDSYEVMIKGKIKNNFLMDNIDTIKDYQNEINKILINSAKEDLVEILIELKINSNELNSLKNIIKRMNEIY